MIEVKKLSKAFGSHRVLEDVSLTIEAGRSAAIIGGSGEGKSVLLKHLVGLLQPDAGEVWVNGENITGMNERQLLRVRRQFGMVFQQAALFDSLTVEENVGFMLRREGDCGPDEIEGRVAETLELVGLGGAQKKMPSELSGGMRKRVGLARAIIYEPQIVLYDEPTTGLDPVMSDSIDKLILRINERLRVTTIVVTHDMRSARRIGQRVYFLNQRSIYAEGSPSEVFDSSDEVVRKFVQGISE